jgi:hypothetical protein
MVVVNHHTNQSILHPLRPFVSEQAKVSTHYDMIQCSFWVSWLEWGTFRTPTIHNSTNINIMHKDE